MQHVFHIPLIAHTKPTDDFEICAHTKKTINMTNWLTERGHITRVYGHEIGAETLNCTEFIPTITEKEFKQSYQDPLANNEPLRFSCTKDYAWMLHNLRGSFELQERAKAGDFVLCFYGKCHQGIAESAAHKGVHIVEPSVGYMGTFAKYRVYESSAWMHFQRGRMQERFDRYDELSEEEKQEVVFDPQMMVSYQTAMEQDIVINSGFDIEKFKIAESHKGYYLCLSRIVLGKGIEMAVELSKEMGKKLIVAGPGDFQRDLGFVPPSHVEVRNAVVGEEKAKLLSEAEAVLCMSDQIETYQFVPIEAMLSGRPPIVRPLGGPRETVIDCLTGFHARNKPDALDALKRIDDINPEVCRQYAINNFGKERVMDQYEAYFASLVHHIKNVEENGDIFYDRPDPIDRLDLYGRYYPEFQPED